MVSGTIALIKYAHPGYSTASTRAALYATARNKKNNYDNIWDSKWGWGLLCVEGAVNSYKCIF